MQRAEIHEKLTMVFRNIFDDDSLEIKEDASPSGDSLAHISLIASIESEFGVKFDMNDLLKIKNVKDIVNLLENKLQ